MLTSERSDRAPFVYGHNWWLGIVVIFTSIASWPGFVFMALDGDRAIERSAPKLIITLPLISFAFAITMWCIARRHLNIHSRRLFVASFVICIICLLWGLAAIASMALFSDLRLD